MLPEATAAPLFLSFLSVLSTDRLTTSRARCAAAVFLIFALCSNSPFASLQPFANDRPFTSPTPTVLASLASPAFVNADCLSFAIASRDSLASTPTPASSLLPFSPLLRVLNHSGTRPPSLVSLKNSFRTHLLGHSDLPPQISFSEIDSKLYVSRPLVSPQSLCMPKSSLPSLCYCLRRVFTLPDR